MKGCWRPNICQEYLLQLIISTTSDCIHGKGTVDASSYAEKLRVYANKIENMNGPARGEGR